MNILNLPPEIRNKIYTLVVHDIDEETLCPFIWQCSPGKRRYGYSLTQVCHQIRQETLQMFHAGKKFLFAMRSENMAYYKNWLQRRPEGIFRSIRRIQLDDYQHCRTRCPEQHPFFCGGAILVNLTKDAPVSWRRDRSCLYCPTKDTAADRVNAVVRTLKRERGCLVLTREKMEEIFEAASWEV